MDAENDALSFLNWDNSIALPVANAENKLLEEAVVKKTHDRNKFLNELGENTSRIQALRDHIKNVKDELLSNQVHIYPICQYIYSNLFEFNLNRIC